MAVSETPRHKFKKYGAGTDPHPSRGTFNGEIDKLEQLPSIKQGSTGSRPLSGVGKVLYWDEAVKRFVYDDGTGWQDVAPLGGVIPKSVAVAATASEGASPRAARADHTHPLPLATTKAPGAMSSEDKTKLDAILATSAWQPLGIFVGQTPSTYTPAYRTSNGRVEVRGAFIKNKSGTVLTTGLPVNLHPKHSFPVSLGFAADINNVATSGGASHGAVGKQGNVYIGATGTAVAIPDGTYIFLDGISWAIGA